MSTEEKIKILSGVNTVEFFVRSKAMDFVDTVSNIHPLLRLYFDSDLSSDIENNSILAITTAIEKCIGAFTQKDFTTYREIGMTIAYGLHKQLYFAKLIHHFNTKRISAEEFYNLAAEHFAVSTANILNSAWDLIGDKIPEILCAGVESMLVSFGVDPLTAHNVSASDISVMRTGRIPSVHVSQNISSYALLRFTTLSSFLSVSEVLESTPKAAASSDLDSIICF